jgi:tRNA modification GTPase
MHMPNTSDTIVAVSTGWRPSPLATVRLSGPASFAWAERIGVRPAGTCWPGWTAGRLQLDERRVLPVTVLWFRAPRSYTGQDVVELHTVGCLPLLRELAARLIELGARRALPGEFTARAFVNARLTAAQVEGVLALMRAGHEAAVREAARLARGLERRVAEEVAEGIVALLALIEAGIDFVEEEDIRFITAEEVVRRIDGLMSGLNAARRQGASDARLGRPHIAVAGLPNAGKSTLFNRLLGYERALVSPVLGTTRDVLSADIEVRGVAAVLQDCAGVGGTADELELACHLASESAAEAADLVLWVHAMNGPWDERETAACTRVAPERRLLVWSKADLVAEGLPPAAAVAFAGTVAVSATYGTGMEGLHELLASRLNGLPPLGGEALREGDYGATVAALGRARAIAAGAVGGLPFPELVALELRAAHEVLAVASSQVLEERLLTRIFETFCVGK